MRRRTLDIIVSLGGLSLAVLLLVLGLVLTDRASFARNYVHDQLVQEDLTFPTADKLGPEEKAFTEARSQCVIENAGQAITTGGQAECYANEYLGGHLTWLATRLGMTQVAYVDGMSYRELGAAQASVREEIAAAKASAAAPDALERDPVTIAERIDVLDQELADVTTVRTKMFEGTMLKNALLTSYGFGTFGETAATTASILYTAAAVLILLSIAGLVHAYRTPPSRTFAPPELSEPVAPAKPMPAEERELVNV